MLSCAGMALIASTRHWAPAAVGMVLFGVGWVAAASMAQAAAQLVSPPWVRARALAIYQLAFNGALAAGSLLWGWLGVTMGLRPSMALAAGVGVLAGVAVRRFGLDTVVVTGVVRATVAAPVGFEAPAPELAAVLGTSRGRVLETVRYRVVPLERARFLVAIEAVRHVRGRAGAVEWGLYEDVSHPEAWLETWAMHDWTDHLREAVRLAPEDHAVLAHVQAWRDEAAPLPCRYISVEPGDGGARNAA